MNKKPTYDELEITLKALEKRVRELKQYGKKVEEFQSIHNLLQFSPHAIFLIDLSGKIVFANKIGAENLGKTSSEIVGTTLREYFPPDVSEKRVRKGMEAFMSGKPQKFEDQAGCRYFETTIVPMKDEKGKPIQLAIYSDDVTERMKTREALKQSEERYRLFVESANEGIILTQEGKLQYINPRALEFIGYSEKEMLSCSFLEFVHPEDLNKIVNLYAAKIRGEDVPLGLSFRIIDKRGEVKWVQSRSSLLTWQGKPALLSLLTDITHQKQLESHIQQAQKMEAIGTLAGGIAHDFNNLLMGIQGRSSLMSSHLPASHPNLEHIEAIEEYVRSAADLTKQLLGLARGGKYEVKPTDINELIKKSSRMFGRTKKEIKIHEKYQRHVWTIEVDQRQVEQVLMNLFVNAWQAMDGGGDLYLQTENVHLDEGYIKAFEIKPGRYVKISVTDNGVGMDEETRQRIFDPFFTTKEMGRGTGLGLASAYGIIENHGGFINVYSEKGKGSTFNIYLPASEKEVVEERELSEDELRGSETILLVDDEDMIIDVGEQLLHKLGYRALIARSGKEAFEVYEMNKDKIDMVILDMIMPAMSGGETYDRLKEVNPDIKVLLSSGYSINKQATEILNRGCNAFIQKPFNIKQLSRKLREVLDKD